MRRRPLPRRPTSPRSAPLRPERCPALRGPLPRTAGPSSPRPAPAALSGPHSRRTDNPRNAPGPGQAAQVRTAPGATTAGQPARGRPARTSQAARPADLSRGKLQGRGAKVSPAQRSAAESSSSCCAAAQLRHPEPPGAFTSCRELREPRGVGGQVAGSARAQSPSLTDCREDSAARRPRKLRVPPSARARRARSPSRAGGDGPSATAISARGEGAPAALSPAPPPPPLSAPSAPGLMDEPRAALASPSLRAQEAASRKQTGRA